MRFFSCASRNCYGAEAAPSFISTLREQEESIFWLACIALVPMPAMLRSTGVNLRRPGIRHLHR